VFQIESRAQMSMLPRLRPRCFYDLVIEVAIVRPGPIQGQMVHPYLRRRNGEEAVSYPDATVERILKKTLGVPLFQEQAMRLAILCAGFTPDEADQLRRAIAAWKSKQKVIYEFGQRIVSGMIARGYDEAFAQRCFQQIQGFSEYGFPESHAASFALIVYVSAWLKVHHPAAFAAALLNSQPMGFYAPAQIVRDAQEHGVPVRRVDVNHSDWDCTLEFSASAPSPFQGEGWGEGGASDVCMTPSCGESLPNPSRSQSPAPPLTQTLPEGERGRSAHPCQREPALRLGMRQVRGLREDEAKKIVAAVREHGAFHDVMSLWRASGVRVPTLRALARADAFASMGLDRQQALWQVRALRDADTPLLDRLAAPPPTPPAPLPPIAPRIKVHHDYAATGLSLKAHPVSFLRPELDGLRVTRNGELKDESRWPNGRRIAVAGVVLVRQRPGTASGIVFMTLEDETGIANLIVRPRVFERYRKAARHGVFVVAKGSVERQGQVVHVMVRAIHEVSDLAAAPGVHRSRDFH
jgi:error-prone DNA polymerase